MSAQIKAAVLGPTGYAGFELTRFLLKHPRLAPPLLLRRETGEGGDLALEDIYPQLSGNGSYAVLPFSWTKLHDAGVDLLFTATPHEVSRELIPEAVRRGLRVVDLSGAWRLRDEANRAVYGFEDADPGAAASLTDAAVYGLPELNRERIAEAQLVANPGCYATSIIVALAPLVRAELVDREHGVVCDSKSGVSGAGKKPTPKTHFVEVAQNLSAYSVFGHRHTGEILEQLGLCPADLIFTPHLLPIPRGILSTIYLRLTRPAEETGIESCFNEFYKGSPWVRVFGAGKLPQIQFSLRTNYCDVGFSLAPDRRRLVLVSCLDNLVKGAAGQAVQNMNVMYGWSEREGLQ
ncbi:MAG TPA: N-acetyl-gamma-glutamyl-phosphate reductase [Clostridia bacterium]|nr:N-acetyl-gamma-glutamyl-phosphate reductase [Clostridia bacterium]